MIATEIRAKINEKVAEAAAILDKGEAEERSLTSEELESWESIAGVGGEIETLKGDLARRERQDALDAESRAPVKGKAPKLPLRNPEDEVPEEERADYSLSRVVQCLATNQRGVSLDGFEGDVHRHLSKEFGHEARGILVPYWALIPKTRAIAALEFREIGKEAPTTVGAALVGTDHLAAAFIELLRNMTYVGQAGATILPGLLGDVSIPKQIGAATGGWQNPEGTGGTPSDSSYGSVTLAPKTAYCITDMTRTMQKQSSPAIEDLVRADIAQVISLLIDSAALTGDGTNRTPVGIKNTSGVHAVNAAGTGGDGWNWGTVVNMEALVAAANALRGSLSYMYGAGVMQLSKTTTKTTTGDATGFLEDAGGVMNGYPRWVTEQVPVQEAVFGNWADLLIGQWGGLDLFSDPYTLGDAGSLRIRGFQDVDVAARHGESFAYATGVGAA